MWFRVPDTFMAPLRATVNGALAGVHAGTGGAVAAEAELMRNVREDAMRGRPLPRGKKSGRGRPPAARTKSPAFVQTRGSATPGK
jgi:hypothetical protein